MILSDNCSMDKNMPSMETPPIPKGTLITDPRGSFGSGINDKSWTWVNPLNPIGIESNLLIAWSSPKEFDCLEQILIY